MLEDVFEKTESSGDDVPLPIFPLMEDEIRRGRIATALGTAWGHRGHLMSPDVKAILEGKSDHKAIFVFPEPWFSRQLAIARSGINLLEAMRFHRIQFAEKGPKSPNGEFHIQKLNEEGDVTGERTVTRLRDESMRMIDDAFEIRGRMGNERCAMLEDRQTIPIAEKTQGIFVEEALRSFHAEIGIPPGKKVNIADVVMSEPGFRARSRAII